MSFIELHIDEQRVPELKTKPITVNTRYIVKVEWIQIIDKDGGATVTSSEGNALQVVESYKSLKKRLKI
jgi:predicted DNA-binding protein (MmcQ/YjbR family)